MQKKLLKKILLGVIIVAIVALALAPTFAVGKKLRYVFVTPATGHQFIQPLIKGMKDAARALGVEADVVGPVEWDLSKTAAMAQAAIDAGVDGMFAQVGDPTTYRDVALRCKKLGIPFIHANITDDTGQTPRDAFVGSSGVLQGELMGEEMIKYLKPGVKVAFFMHMPHVQLKQRLQGAEKVLRKYGITEWEEVVCGSEMTKAVATIESYLLGHPDVAGVYGVDGISTPACATALGRKPELWGKVHTGGFDLIPATLEGIKKGYVDFTMDQMPYQYGYHPVVIMYLYDKFGIRPADVITKVGAVDRSNLEGVIKLVEEGYR